MKVLHINQGFRFILEACKIYTKSSDPKRRYYRADCIYKRRREIVGCQPFRFKPVIAGGMHQLCLSAQINSKNICHFTKFYCKINFFCVTQASFQAISILKSRRDCFYRKLEDFRILAKMQLSVLSEMWT